MSTAKIAVTLDERLLEELDRLVQEQKFPSRSSAVQEAIQEKLSRLRRTRLARECAKLNPKQEQQLAEEGLSRDIHEWPEY